MFFLCGALQLQSAEGPLQKGLSAKALKGLLATLYSRWTSAPCRRSAGAGACSIRLKSSGPTVPGTLHRSLSHRKKRRQLCLRLAPRRLWTPSSKAMPTLLRHQATRAIPTVGTTRGISIFRRHRATTAIPMPAAVSALPPPSGYSAPSACATPARAPPALDAATDLFDVREDDGDEDGGRAADGRGRGAVQRACRSRRPFTRLLPFAQGGGGGAAAQLALFVGLEAFSGGAIAVRISVFRSAERARRGGGGAGRAPRAGALRQAGALLRRRPERAGGAGGMHGGAEAVLDAALCHEEDPAVLAQLLMSSPLCQFQLLSAGPQPRLLASAAIDLAAMSHDIATITPALVRPGDVGAQLLGEITCSITRACRATTARGTPTACSRPLARTRARARSLAPTARWPMGAWAAARAHLTPAAGTDCMARAPPPPPPCPGRSRRGRGRTTPPPSAHPSSAPASPRSRTGSMLARAARRAAARGRRVQGACRVQGASGVHLAVPVIRVQGACGVQGRCAVCPPPHLCRCRVRGQGREAEAGRGQACESRGRRECVGLGGRGPAPRCGRGGRSSPSPCTRRRATRPPRRPRSHTARRSRTGTRGG